MEKAESILVVDDVKEHCEIAFRILKKMDYLVTSVSTVKKRYTLGKTGLAL